MMSKVILTNRHQRILTDEDIEELIFMYKTGKFYIREIAEWFGISSSGVLYWLKKKGVL